MVIRGNTANITKLVRQSLPRSESKLSPRGARHRSDVLGAVEGPLAERIASTILPKRDRHPGSCSRTARWAEIEISGDWLPHTLPGRSRAPPTPRSWLCSANSPIPTHRSTPRDNQQAEAEAPGDRLAALFDRSRTLTNSEEPMSCTFCQPPPVGSPRLSGSRGRDQGLWCWHLRTARGRNPTPPTPKSRLLIRIYQRHPISHP